MQYIYIILLTLIIRSVISTLVITFCDDDRVEVVFTYGITGCIVGVIVYLIRKSYQFFRYRFHKRSILEEPTTGSKFKCRVSATDDLLFCTNYRLIERYASRNTYKDIPDFEKEFIQKSKRNCMHCKHSKESESWEDTYACFRGTRVSSGMFMEFDCFEKK
ncbi:MAG: hypothetical protein NC084_04065 [Bacteroides sp.]|nr:hypothetical protein [Eubacterium sp.]MCM1417659.1 hypothetical protein [Roseburia sp.]MCM1461876.1 hypothetical protein [Bacteroides sp.]